MQDGSTEETDERDCTQLCFFDVSNDINLQLTTCSIHQSRNKRDIQKSVWLVDMLNSTTSKQERYPIKRLVGGNTAVTGAFPYVVRLTFQNFDQFHSDSQACF